ncbi:MAG: carbon-nitrogen hydrolase family protein [Gemmatimonadota bacterium]
MKLVLFQPPYPAAASPIGAAACLQWMRDRLDALIPEEQDLVLLPEYANAPGLTERQPLRDFATTHGAGFLGAVAASARRLGSLVALSAVTPSGALWYNRTVVYGAAGQTVATYDKVHLTDVESGELGVTPGASAAVCTLAGVRLGFATCFDLYFPEHFEALAAHGLDLVLCPSYQRSESPERIRLIAQARALDSGAYLARSSYALGSPTAGGTSLVASPSGALLADAGPLPRVLALEIDPGAKFVKPASHGQPPVEHRALIEAHRRPSAYRPLPGSA